MIKVNCQVDTVVPFTELLPFQGNLKQRSEQDVRNLAESLTTVGLITPFIVWHKPTTGVPELGQPNYLLDGHARYGAIQKIAETDPEVLKQEYPTIVVVAETIEEAKRMLLEISSQYGKITKKGLSVFLQDAPKIPLEKMGLRVKLPTVNVPTVRQPVDQKAVLKLRVPKDKVPEVMEVLRSCSFIEVL